MSHLSEALQRYYSRESKRIVFRDSLSLNQLALEMWEALGCQQVDASVLSRVLKGERLFTAPQLKVFCELLSLPKDEEEYLFICLEQDQSPGLNQYFDTTHISASLAEEIIAELTKDSFDMFYRAEYVTLEKHCELVQQLAKTYVVGNGHATIDERLGLNLYLKGRTVLRGSSASQAIKHTYPIFRQLLAISRASNSSTLYGYAYALLSDAYYGAGGYSDVPTKRKFYSASIKFAKEAIDNLPDDDREALYALRTMVASAHYIRDEQTTRYVIKRARTIVPMQPEENYVNVLHLSATIGKAAAALRISDPFLVQELAIHHFQRDLAHTGLHEISGIREEIETLLYLKTEDTNYIEDRLRTGIDLATTFNFPRHKKHLNKLLREVGTS